MEVKNRISLSSLIKEFNFEEIYIAGNADDIFITVPEVDRPGLALSGFFDFFEHERIQLIGIAEYTYLTAMTDEKRDSHIRDFVAHKPAAIIFTSGNKPFTEFIKNMYYIFRWYISRGRRFHRRNDFKRYPRSRPNGNGCIYTCISDCRRSWISCINRFTF